MKWKLKRNQTSTDRDRIKSLEDQMADTTARLDAAVAESKRLALAMDEFQKRDHLRELRKALKKRFGPRQPSDVQSYDPKDTVN